MHIQIKNVLTLIIAVFVLTAFAQSPVVTVDAPPARAVLDESYLLGPGDKLNVVVFNHEDLSVLCVDELGTVFFWVFIQFIPNFQHSCHS